MEVVDNTVSYYDADYFDWQKKIGIFGGMANLKKFKDKVTEEDCVIDFGCGGGYLLKNLNCREKIGIEINDVAHAQIRENGVQPFSSPFELFSDKGYEFADRIISNHALEHTQNPFSELQSLLPLLKKGGTIHFFVPCDSFSNSWKPNDINFHLFSWSPMNLGNLFEAVGFKIIKAKPYIHKWPPFYDVLQRLLGWKLFHLLCFVYGRFSRKWFQIEVFAVKE